MFLERIDSNLSSHLRNLAKFLCDTNVYVNKWIHAEPKLTQEYNTGQVHITTYMSI